MTWEILIKIGHIVGTVLGVGGATFAEVFYYKAKKEGLLDNEAARGFSGAVYQVLRLGTVLLVVSGFGYLLLLRYEGATQHIYSPRVWAKMTITAIILINAVLMQTRKIPMRLGAPISLASWYAALVIGSWRMDASFWEIMAVYAAAIVLIGIVQRSVYKNLESKT